MRWAYLTLATIATTSLVWMAGEHHRQSCIRANRVSCSVLPWVNGTKPKPRPVNDFDGGGDGNGAYGGNGYDCG